MAGVSAVVTKERCRSAGNRRRERLSNKTPSPPPSPREFSSYVYARTMTSTPACHISSHQGQRNPTNFKDPSHQKQDSKHVYQCSVSTRKASKVQTMTPAKTNAACNNTISNQQTMTPKISNASASIGSVGTMTEKRQIWNSNLDSRIIYRYEVDNKNFCDKFSQSSQSMIIQDESFRDTEPDEDSEKELYYNNYIPSSRVTNTTKSSYSISSRKPSALCKRRNLYNEGISDDIAFNLSVQYDKMRNSPSHVVFADSEPVFNPENTDMDWIPYSHKSSKYHINCKHPSFLQYRADTESDDLMGTSYAKNIEAYSATVAPRRPVVHDSVDCDADSEDDHNQLDSSECHGPYLRPPVCLRESNSPKPFLPSQMNYEIGDESCQSCDEPVRMPFPHNSLNYHDPCKYIDQPVPNYLSISSLPRCPVYSRCGPTRLPPSPTLQSSKKCPKLKDSLNDDTHCSPEIELNISPPSKYHTKCFSPDSEPRRYKNKPRICYDDVITDDNNDDVSVVEALRSQSRGQLPGGTRRRHMISPLPPIESCVPMVCYPSGVNCAQIVNIPFSHKRKTKAHAHCLEPPTTKQGKCQVKVRCVDNIRSEPCNVWCQKQESSIPYSHRGSSKYHRKCKPECDCKIVDLMSDYACPKQQNMLFYSLPPSPSVFA